MHSHTHSITLPGTAPTRVKPLVVLSRDTGSESQAVRDFAAVHGFSIMSPADIPRGADSTSPAHTTIQSALEKLLAEGVDGAETVAFAADSSFLDGDLASHCDAIILCLHDSLEERGGRIPACTLVTSLFRSDEFISGFLSNISALHGYGDTIEHVILFSETSTFERGLLARHLLHHPGTLLIRNRQDPGLYECWNQGIRLSRAEYVSNANVDDLRDPRHVSSLVECLASRPGTAVAASSLVPFYEYSPDLSVIDASKPWYADQAGDFGFLNLARLITREDGSMGLDPHNLPHCMPIWRKSLHETFGYFDEKRYGTFADWAFWLDVTRAGLTGYLHPAPLSYYYVNLASHNRRGNLLEHYHKSVENQYLESFVCRTHGYVTPTPNALIGPLPPSTPKKLNLTGTDAIYGQHRNSFNKIVQSLEPLHRGPGGVHLIPFIERQFVWGDDDGEAASANPRPLDHPWIGILHCPFDAPPWFHPEIGPEAIFATKLWRDSLPSCRGIICLSNDIAADLQEHLPEIPSVSIKHPTAFGAKSFCPDAYRRRPRLVQIGDWLRKLQSIHRIHSCGHQKIMLMKHHTRSYLEKEEAIFGKVIDPSVAMIDFVSNEEYDELLISSVVLCLLYASSANNVILECIARATPIIVNPIPSVVEYLGLDYPLYARSIEEAECHLCDTERILEAHEYLKTSIDRSELSYESFRNRFAASQLYKNL